jgi:hypothetical protein
MAKLRSLTEVPLPRSEEEFLSAAPTTSVAAENGNTPSAVRVGAAADSVPSQGMGEEEFVALTIHIPRNMRDALAARAKADERSISQIARRLLAPLLL